MKLIFGVLLSGCSEQAMGEFTFPAVHRGFGPSCVTFPWHSSPAFEVRLDACLPVCHRDAMKIHVSEALQDERCCVSAKYSYYCCCERSGTHLNRVGL